MMHDALPVKRTSNIIFPLEQFCQNLMALDSDGNFHMGNCNLLLELEKAMVIICCVEELTNLHAITIFFLHQQDALRNVTHFQILSDDAVTAINQNSSFICNCLYCLTTIRVHNQLHLCHIFHVP